MNKSELTDKIYAEHGKDIKSRAAAERIVNAVFEGIRTEVASGGRVQIDKFGTFLVTRRSERKASDPNTHKDILVPGKNGVRFKPTQNFKEIVQSVNVDA